MRSSFSIRNKKVFYKEIPLDVLSTEKFEVVHQIKNYNEVDRGFVKDKNGIWWFHSAKKKASMLKSISKNLNTFKAIDNIYSLDKENVFCSDSTCEIIPNADPSSFTVLKNSPYFAKDKNQVYSHSYHTGLQIIKEADPETFIDCGWNQYATDKDNLYHYYGFLRKSNDSKYKKHQGSLPQDWAALAFNWKGLGFNLEEMYPDLSQYWWCEDYTKDPRQAKQIDENYFKSDHAVFFRKDDNSPNLLDKADLDTFKVLSSYFAKDINTCYYNENSIQEADPDSFEVLGKHISRDKNFFFYRGNKAGSTQSKTFHFISYEEFAEVACVENTLLVPTIRREKFEAPRQVLTPLKSSDANSFEKISSKWAKDKNNVYCGLRPVKKLESKTFEHLVEIGVNDWAKDKNYLYNANGTKLINGIDGCSFIKLNNFWGQDKNQVFSFYTGRIQKNIDRKTFKVVDDNGRAEDQYYQYWIDDFEIKKKLKVANKQ